MATGQPKIWKTWERCVTIYDEVVVKRELHEHELMHNLYGYIMRPFWAKERLQNEAATLQLVARETTIPVPECRLYIKEEVLCLETKRITNGVLLEEIKGPSRLAAVADVQIS
ncbi:hypothetical protein VFPPC_18226 [Pochonia chlamydosporia 170]|uniref:Uncharacterized protein n=1 Tax=Pochonia chlamydosporia 170 TaxID=1380566 RepID=A0A219AQN8_METCM|nr:hypothetical protein VFPPC_18226 [Pochonia chlamydosporia 170]OWT42614.1 hypothetical protein VFPPC_18226 [Pochonia chlamydosporia 170]